MKISLISKISRCIALVASIIMLSSCITGCSKLDILGVGNGGAVTDTNPADAEDSEKSSDFLKGDKVMTFFEGAPGDAINGMSDYLKMIINATYVDEINLSTKNEGFTNKAWKLVYAVLNETAQAGKNKDFSTKKGSAFFEVSEATVEGYIESMFGAIDKKTSDSILEHMNTDSILIKHHSAKSKYSIAMSDPAEYNAELIDIKIVKNMKTASANASEAAVFTYQLSDLSKKKLSLGKVKLALVKDEESEFEYIIAQTNYNSNGMGKSLVKVDKASATASAIASADPS